MGVLQYAIEGLPGLASMEEDLVSRQFGVYCLNACRVVYFVDEEDGPVRRAGFAYGTLPSHVEKGEERFSVEWNQETDVVRYDILAFSRPNSLATWIGYPLSRRIQKTFAAESARILRSRVDQ